MKKVITCFVLMLVTTFAFAQAPQGMNYQAVARSSSGSILANQNISLRISITPTSAGVLPYYIETHAVTTNQFGLFTLNVGNGTPVQGTFAAIPWSISSPWLKVQMDATGGTNYVLMGISQLLSVPYSLYSQNSVDTTRWSLHGNAGTDSTSFIGTTDGQPLRLKINNIPYGFISASNGSILLGSGNYAIGQANVGIGEAALQGTTGNNNTAVGEGALQANASANSVSNTAVGSGALFANDGIGNTAMGAFTSSNSGLTNNCILLGYAASAGTDAAVIGNSGLGVIGGYQDWTNLSDARFKTDVKENVPGLNFILKLRPVTYKFEARKLERFQGRPDSLINKISSSYDAAEKTVRTGFIAQEVEQAANQTGFDFNAVHKPQDEKDHYGLAYAEFVVPLVKAVQEQQKEIEEQKAQLEKQNKMIEELRAEMKKVEGK